MCTKLITIGIYILFSSTWIRKDRNNFIFHLPQFSYSLVAHYFYSDLQRAIHKKPGMLKDVHRRFIMYQLLSATRFLHKGKVIHRDQKPSNVLLDTDCIVKIADFGLARSLTHLKQQEEPDAAPHPLTDYVATRWYRSPEILIGCKEYTEGIDIWSLGSNSTTT